MREGWSVYIHTYVGRERRGGVLWHPEEVAAAYPLKVCSGKGQRVREGERDGEV